MNDTYSNRCNECGIEPGVLTQDGVQVSGGHVCADGNCVAPMGLVEWNVTNLKHPSNNPPSEFPLLTAMVGGVRVHQTQQHPCRLCTIEREINADQSALIGEARRILRNHTHGLREATAMRMNELRALEAENAALKAEVARLTALLPSTLPGKEKQ